LVAGLVAGGVGTGVWGLVRLYRLHKRQDARVSADWAARRT
jgi:hypothetical protein